MVTSKDLSEQLLLMSYLIRTETDLTRAALLESCTLLIFESILVKTYGVPESDLNHDEYLLGMENLIHDGKYFRRHK